MFYNEATCLIMEMIFLCMRIKHHWLSLNRFASNLALKERPRPGQHGNDLTLVAIRKLVRFEGWVIIQVGKGWIKRFKFLSNIFIVMECKILYLGI